MPAGHPKDSEPTAYFPLCPLKHGIPFPAKNARRVFPPRVFLYKTQAVLADLTAVAC